MRTSHFTFPLFISALLLSGCSAPVSESSSAAPKVSEQQVVSEVISAAENTAVAETADCEDSSAADAEFPSGGSVGWQASGEFMIYDTSAHRYRTVVGEPIDIDDMYAMDSTGVLPLKDLDFPEAQIIGNKFYALGGSEFMSGVIFYIYENGAFTEVRGAYPEKDEMPIRISGNPSKDTVPIDDYDAVISSMVAPLEAAAVVQNAQ